jgi:GNAT superfamily N-acetyltransferase
MVDLMVTYLEMSAPPVSAPKPPTVAGLTVEREHMSRAGYLALYRRVGEPVQWDQRLRLDPETLDKLLEDPSTHIHVLRLDGEAMGLCEFAQVGKPFVELVHFGLAPEMQDKGFGGFLLDHALRRCWEHAPKRIWLHTDTNDHPKALSVYSKVGFRPYLRRLESFPD